MTPTCEHTPPEASCQKCQHVTYRRGVILTRAMHNPLGLPPWRYTQGLTKDDALQFWNDAKFLGLVRVGTTRRGSPLYALPSYEVKL